MDEGYEALTLFHDGTRPDRRFADAAAVGLGLELESACLSAAISASTGLPGPGFLSLNVSPELLLERHRLGRCLRGQARPVVLEVTEHVAIEDYAAIREAVSSAGADVRIAVEPARLPDVSVVVIDCIVVPILSREPIPMHRPRHG